MSQKSWFESHTPVIWSINSGSLIINFLLSDLHIVFVSSAKKNKERYFCYNHLFIKFGYLFSPFYIHYSRKNVQKKLHSICLFSRSFKPNGSLTVFVLSGVNNNTLLRELRPVVLDLHHVAAFVVSSFNCECLDQLITLIRN